MRRTVSSPKVTIPKGRSIQESYMTTRSVGSARKPLKKIKKIKPIK